MYHFPLGLDAGCDRTPPAGAAAAPGATERRPATRERARR